MGHLHSRPLEKGGLSFLDPRPCLLLSGFSTSVQVSTLSKVPVGFPVVLRWSGLVTAWREILGSPLPGPLMIQI